MGNSPVVINAPFEQINSSIKGGVFDLLHTGVAFFSQKGLFTYCNNAFLRMFSLPDNIAGKHITDFFQSEQDCIRSIKTLKKMEVRPIQTISNISGVSFRYPIYNYKHKFCGLIIESIPMNLDKEQLLALFRNVRSLEQQSPLALAEAEQTDGQPSATSEPVASQSGFGGSHKADALELKGGTKTWAKEWKDGRGIAGQSGKDEPKDTFKDASKDNRPVLSTFDTIIGRSQPMEQLCRLGRRFARTQEPILITGESGTGKELLAQALHCASQRASRPFISVNCAALPHDLIESELFGYETGSFTGARSGGMKGKFEQADTGTIFLDEIGELPLPLQAKLLRVLESGEIQKIGHKGLLRCDFRLLGATNRNLPQMVRDGLFREDLYHRLSVFELLIPPLRERGDDIFLLARYYLEQYVGGERGHNIRLDEELCRVFREYPWHGNIRELKNTLVYAIYSLGEDQDVLGIPHLPPRFMREWHETKARTVHNGQENRLGDAQTRNLSGPPCYGDMTSLSIQSRTAPPYSAASGYTWANSQADMAAHPYSPPYAGVWSVPHEHAGANPANRPAQYPTEYHDPVDAGQSGQDRPMSHSPASRSGADLLEASAQAERKILRDTLERLRYNKVLTAQELGISRSKLYRKLRKYGLLTGTEENLTTVR